jgi:general secretion pathway protein F
MGAYEYTALDARGRTRRGVLEGDTPRQVRSHLRDQGLTPLSVAEVVQRERERHRSRRRSLLARGLSSTDLTLVTRQLATLTRSALPLEEALRTVAQQTERARISRVILAVRSRVMEGHPLASGLADFPTSFSELYRATVAAGEQSGHLDVVLERLADYTEQRHAMRQRIQLALFYPALLTTMAVVVTIALMVYVVPQVVRVFEDVGQTLPVLTRGLITVSDFLREYGSVLLAGLLAGGIAARYALRIRGARSASHRFVLTLPVVGRLVRGLNTARFGRTLSILVASGVEVLEALRISAQVMSNLPMRRAVEDAALRVREGASLHGSLERSRLFPPMTLSLIASGEASGKLEEMLERAATQQEREVETLVAALLGLFEPLLILVMGGVVLVIVLAILLPIFDLNQLVK